MSHLKRILFYFLWPLVWVYSPLTRRVRVLIMCEGELLAVKNAFGPGVWQLPGGGIKFGEKVEQAARREVHEELGFKLPNLKLLHDDAKVVKQFGLLMRYHFAFAELKEKPGIVTSNELTDAQWLSVTDTENCSVEVRTALKLVI